MAPGAARPTRMYEGRYPLVSALSRPVIVKHLVAAARYFGADARWPTAAPARATTRCASRCPLGPSRPDLDVIAPVRGWGMTREDSIHYAYDHDIPIQATKEKLYSIDDNLWGRAIECGEMEDPWAVPPPGVWLLTRQTETEPRDVVIGFDQGMPVTVDGERLGMLEIIETLNTDRRILRLGSHRHGGEPEGRHQESGDLRMPGQPWRSSWPTRIWNRSASNATSTGRRPASSPGTPS